MNRNVTALRLLFEQWAAEGGRVPSWEFLADHGVLAVDALTDSQLVDLTANEPTDYLRAALRRLATGGRDGE